MSHQNPPLPGPIHPGSMTYAEMSDAVLSDSTLAYYFALNGGSGPVSEKGINVFRAVERAVLERLEREKAQP